MCTNIIRMVGLAGLGQVVPTDFLKGGSCLCVLRIPLLNSHLCHVCIAMPAHSQTASKNSLCVETVKKVFDFV